MHELQYIPAVRPDAPLELDGPVAFVGVGEGMRGHEWKYTLGYRDVMSTSRPAREVEVGFWTDRETMDALRRAADADAMARKPGTFVAQGEWKQRGYVVAMSIGNVHYDRIQAQMTVVLLEGAWWRLVSKSMVPDSSEGGDYPYLDFPHDGTYDYMKTTNSHEVEPSVLTPSPVRIVVNGPATDPTIVIGGNSYELDMTVESGAYVTVDGRDKTIVYTRADGSVENAFANGVRGSGLGGGAYIFEPVPMGTSTCAWDGTFSFEIGWYEEEGEPPWSQS